MGDRQPAVGVALQCTKLRGQPAVAVLKQRGVGEARVDLVTRGNQDATTRVEEVDDCRGLLGIESFDVSQHDHALIFQINGAESIRPDGPCLDLKCLGAGRRERGPEEVRLAR